MHSQRSLTKSSIEQCTWIVCVGTWGEVLAFCGLCSGRQVDLENSPTGNGQPNWLEQQGVLNTWVSLYRPAQKSHGLTSIPFSLFSEMRRQYGPLSHSHCTGAQRFLRWSPYLNYYIGYKTSHTTYRDPCLQISMPSTANSSGMVGQSG